MRARPLRRGVCSRNLRFVSARAVQRPAESHWLSRMSSWAFSKCFWTANVREMPPWACSERQRPTSVCFVRARQIRAVSRALQLVLFALNVLECFFDVLCSTSCPAGRFQDINGQWTCRICPSGRFSLESAPECSPCGDGSIAPDPESSECIPCDDNSEPSVLKDSCACDPGFFLPDHKNVFDSCMPCPNGADCTSAGTTFTTLETVPGFWRSDNKSAIFYRCIKAEYCTNAEGKGSQDALGGCAENRRGPLCALCDEDYFEGLVGGCQACPAKTAGSYAYIVLMGLLLVCFCWIFPF